MAAIGGTDSGLWKTAFAVTDQDGHSKERERLRVALASFRSNVEPIVARISTVLPNLTVHDVTHLDALWTTADTIAGEGYPLNPLEAFVFGGAVLLHDAAMCWEAYAGGQTGVRETPAWADAFTAESESGSAASQEDMSATADFVALRELHAERARDLPLMSWKNPDSGESIFLIEDDVLRNEMGPLIGKIAASHHWDIEQVESSLRNQVNAPAGFPMEWTIDTVKVACLLRCADAAHVNQDRSPLFLYALVKREGLSREHWKAQARMQGPARDIIM